jgi:3-methylcrotonyl-CoA carboxylase alpha subunit
MIRTLLIANRGEIACRIVRTARRLGVATVAVYSDADAHALHVAAADRAVRIGPPAPRESYLRIDAILDAARRAGADAIHPGYGFLAENAAFAEACADAGLIFVGPPPAAIRAMGGKAEAKALMAAAGVPLVPGYHGAAQDVATLAAEAARIGYPVLIKASAGGGGKGMRVVAAPAGFATALAGAQREAASSFGDDRVLIERYLTRPRHVEIQVFADAHGNVVHLFERDCSVQRRHQKIVEEAPAPGITAALRAEMGAAAVAAARAVNYVGAGTVEFIMADGAFHFMEMNTRLQVEHPVTEAITGLDLVEWQLRVAAGEPLPLRQSDLVPSGHAVEVRLCAEDPAHDYLPSIGRLTHLRLPDTIRVDTGVRAGDAITSDYDPMIAKLIAHGPDRATALARLAAALRTTEAAGVRTNLSLLRAVIEHPAFRAGDVHTGFLVEHAATLAPPTEAPDAALAAAAVAVLRRRAAAGRNDGDPGSPWGDADSWRMNLDGSQLVVLRHGETTAALVATSTGHDAWTLARDGGALAVAASATADGRLLLAVDGLTRPVGVVAAGDGISVSLDGAAYTFAVIDPTAPPQAETAGGGRVMAPIPGRVASVLVAVGDVVARGQALVVLEAMKMELTLTASRDGVIAVVRCVAGEMVEEGVELVELVEPEGEGAAT